MKTFMNLMLVLSICLFGYGVKQHYYRLSDQYLRERVVLLASTHGLCSGIEVMAPSGKILTLTAGHCAPIFVDGVVTAIQEDGTKTDIKLLSEDPESDLIVAEGVGKRYVKIAKDVYDLEKVHTMTHGGGQRAYRTDGEVIDVLMMDIPIMDLDSPDNVKLCNKTPKYKPGTIPFIFGMSTPVCFLHVKQLETTALVIPGSSGGPLFNASNELVGIVSASAMEIFSTYSTPQDIASFLRDK